MFSLNDSMRYWHYSEPTDMRKSFFSLQLPELSQGNGSRMYSKGCLITILAKETLLNSCPETGKTIRQIVNFFD